MGQKLYIPTSSLNLKRILTTESISPASFYGERSFGFKNFEKVKLNDLDNVILLYDYCPEFAVDNNEKENYPMVIEIDLDHIPKGIINTTGKFTTKTIYLNPSSTRFIFFNKEGLNSAKYHCEASIESKMLELMYKAGDPLITYYPREATNSDKKKICKKFTKRSTEKASKQKLDKQQIQYDEYIDRLRGFMYGYVLGSLKSESNEQVTLKSIATNLNNLWSSISQSFLGQKTAVMDKMTVELKNLSSHIETIPANSSNLGDAPEIDSLPGLNISPMEICNYPHSTQKKSVFLTKLFNDILKQTTKEMFVTDLKGFTRNVGLVFKNELQEKWEDSPARQYINKLRENIETYSEFDIHSTQNSTLLCVAAFCKGGDSDIDKLEDSLVKNRIPNKNIAYALWGLTFGYAEMPRTIIDTIVESVGQEKFNKIYAHIHGELHQAKINILDSYDAELEGIEKKLEGVGISPLRIRRIIWRYVFCGKNWDETIFDLINVRNDDVGEGIIDKACTALGIDNPTLGKSFTGRSSTSKPAKPKKAETYSQGSLNLPND